MVVPYDVVQDIIKVLGDISRGTLPTRACDVVGISYSTFCTYTKKYPQLGLMREEAEDRLYDVLADRLLTIHEDITEPKLAGIVSSNTKWLLERRRSKSYGTRSTVEHTITADREVLEALNRAKSHAQGVVIEAVVNHVALDVVDALAIPDDAPDGLPDDLAALLFELEAEA